MKRFSNSLMLSCLISGLAVSCTKSDPPCPPTPRTVAAKDADDALARRARREASKDPPYSAEAEAIEFWCKESSSLFENEVVLKFSDVLDCLPFVGHSWATLSECLNASAISKFAWKVPGVTVDGVGYGDKAKKVRPTTTCVEKSRNVDVKAEKNEVNRSSSEDWVEAVLVLIVNVVDVAAAPAMAPASFLIKPSAADEEACIDLPDPPVKKCTGADGCPDVPPGAETPGESSSGGADVIPPGTDPGTRLPGGDGL